MDIVGVLQQFHTVTPAITLVLWAIFIVALISYIVYSAILFWHWKEYSTGKYTTYATMLIYGGVSVMLFALMATTIMWFS